MNSSRYGHGRWSCPISKNAELALPTGSRATHHRRYEGSLGAMSCGRMRRLRSFET
jgi:hypothetical protein